MGAAKGPRIAGSRRFGPLAAIAARCRLPVRRRRPAALALAVAALAAALLLAAVVALLSSREPKGGARAVTAAVAGEGVYQPLPEITADLRSPSPQLHYVQLAAVIEIAEGDAAALQAQQQPIIADLQRALRELGRQELAGAAGSERVRALFTRIIEHHLAPARVRSVLFTRFLVD